MQQAGYHHANMLAAQLREDMTNQNAQLMAMMQSVQPTEEEPPELAVNVTVTDNVQLEMLQLLRTMQQNLMVNNNRQDNPTGQRRRNRNRRTPDDASFNRQVTNEFCWTHGACNHNSDKCEARAPGHQANATFDNRMNGSNAFCPT